MRKKIILFLTAFLCVLMMLGSFRSAMADRKVAVPENPIQGIHEESSQVLWTGKGYKTRLVLDDPPENITEEVLEEEPEEEKPPEVPEEPEKEEEPGKTEETTRSEPNTVTYDDGDGDGENSGETQDAPDDDTNQDGAQLPTEEEADPEEDYYPTVASDLTDGETVGASYRTFYVRGEDYKGNYIGSSGLEVYGNGEKLYSTQDDGEMVKYRLDLQDGENKIIIKAVDSEGRTTTVSYTIYRGEEEEPVPAGTVVFSLEATTVGLGYLIGPSEEVYYEGEQLSYIIDRVLQKYGYTYRYDGSLTNGFYLKHVISPGITNGYSIPDDLYAKLQEVNCQIEDYHLDSLGEFDFTKNSGWMYFVNGAQMSSGISTYYPGDGDEIRIRFSLYAGADVGGSMQGETWGDW